MAVDIFLEMYAGVANRVGVCQVEDFSRSPFCPGPPRALASRLNISHARGNHRNRVSSPFSVAHEFHRLNRLFDFAI
jgi:hypothetical protein